MIGVPQQTATLCGVVLRPERSHGCSGLSLTKGGIREIAAQPIVYSVRAAENRVQRHQADGIEALNLLCNCLAESYSHARRCQRHLRQGNVAGDDLKALPPQSSRTQTKRREGLSIPSRPRRTTLSMTSIQFCIKPMKTLPNETIEDRCKRMLALARERKLRGPSSSVGDVTVTSFSRRPLEHLVSMAGTQAIRCTCDSRFLCTHAAKAIDAKERAKKRSQPNLERLLRRSLARVA